MTKNAEPARGRHNRKVKMKTEIVIIKQDGSTRSTHRTMAAAERTMARNLAWRCGICGSTRKGWGKCSHGQHNRVCSAEHYNDKIVEREVAQ